MKIGILPLAAGRQAGGPEVYEVQLLRALARIDHSNEYVLYCPESAAVDAIGVRQENFHYHLLRPALRPLSIACALPRLLRKDQVDLFHATYAPPPFIGTKMVFTMHGLVNFLHPQFFPRLTRLRLNPLMKVGLRRASAILCVSQRVQAQLRTICGIAAERLVVSHLGVGPEFKPMPQAQVTSWLAQAYNLTDPYFLYVGKCHPAKNLSRLLYAYAQFRQATQANVKLVLAGAQTRHTPEAARIHELGLNEWVVQLPYLSATELATVYSGAEAFLFPSLFESFGLPVVEAMACGTPVLTANVECLPEITGGAAMLVDPLAVNQIADGIARLHASPELRTTMRIKGLQQARRFSWTACARITLATYHALVTNEHQQEGTSERWAGA